MALFIHAVLGEDAAQIRLAGFGGSVGLLAPPSGQLFAAHGHAGAIAADIHHRRVAPGGLSWAFLPGLRLLSHPLGHALDLPGRDMDAAGFCQMLFRLWVARFIGALQTHQPGQSGRVTDLQTQGGVGWKVALLLAGMIVVVARQFKRPEQALHLQTMPAPALLAGLKMAVRTNSSSSCTNWPCGAWPAKRAINCWISSSWARRTWGARSFF